MIFHDHSCRATLHPQRARCTCGAIQDDHAPTLSCPVCSAELPLGSGWLHAVVVYGQAYRVITCMAEDCKSQAEAACKKLLPRPDGFSQDQVDAAKAVLLAPVPKSKRR